MAVIALFGSGRPLVLVPGIQGRWEWMQPTVDALARHFRVVTFSLCGDRDSGCPIDPALGFDNHVVQLDQVLDEAGVGSAILCGVSYGGLVAVCYAAERAARVSHLVISSAPAPDWNPPLSTRRWAARPFLHAPAFVLNSPGRLWPEAVAACGGRMAALLFLARHGLRAAISPMSPSCMGRRVALIDGHDFVADARRVACPTLVTTGEPSLDRVVPVEGTLRYLTHIQPARHVVIERTGHIGMVSRPDRYAKIVDAFVREGG